MSQEIERPVLVEGQICVLHFFYLLSVLQQFDVNVGWVKLRHVAVQEVQFAILWWVAGVYLHLWGTLDSVRVVQ